MTGSRYVWRRLNTLAPTLGSRREVAGPGKLGAAEALADLPARTSAIKDVERSVLRSLLCGRAGIEEAFRQLGDRLAKRGVVADIYVFGGAAMALAYDSRRATRDVDALFKPHGIVLEEARAVAAELGLPNWWLNEQASSYAAPLRACRMRADPAGSVLPVAQAMTAQPGHSCRKWAAW
jgi:hypothetical protein